MALTAIPAGKVPTDLLARLLAADRPLPPEVRLGPGIGEDACAIDVEAGVLIAATDPITLTTSELGRYGVIVNANDVAVMGVRPRWFLATVLLPLGTTTDTIEQLFASMRSGLDEVGATLVGGHTEVTGAVSQPVIVGQMLGLATDGRFVATAGARSGDIIVQVGPVPIEGAAVLAVEAADRLAAVDDEVVAAAARAQRDPGISVVDAAIAATSLGATAMHDPTEGGAASGLHELALAAGAAVRVDRSQVAWFDPGVQVCRALGADPWATLASGSLLATFPPERVDAAVEVLSSPNRPAVVIGAMEAGAGVRDVNGMPIEWPDRDEVARVLAT
ncbi:MAG TPA: AIR synthase-related protein [Acidimicrobiales bacterium]|nr:AIR synthase-related protein [Acidimicrobiales bacterium]